MQQELNALLTHAAFAPLTGRSFLRITGEDRTRWLNGMVTNSIQALEPGQGNYNFLLNAQGRIQGDATIFRDPDPAAAEFLVETSTAQIAEIQQLLDRFIIMDDVELMPIMDDQHALLVAGPNAAARLTSLSMPTPAATGMARASFGGQPVIVITPHAPLVPAYEIWAAPETITALRTGLEASATPEVSQEAFETLRILSGTPAYGTDIRNSETAKDLPQETAQTHALHFNKGCYLGQEIVERIRSRGQIHKTFSGFTLSALPASLPAPLLAEGKQVGELTSATGWPIPDDGSIAGMSEEPQGPEAGQPRQQGAIALGYIRREALDRNLALTFEGGTATAAPLPFSVP